MGVLVFHGEEFQIPVPTQCGHLRENENVFYIFCLVIQCKVLIFGGGGSCGRGFGAPWLLIVAYDFSDTLLFRVWGLGNGQSSISLKKQPISFTLVFRVWFKIILDSGWRFAGNANQYVSYQFFSTVLNKKFYIYIYIFIYTFVYNFVE